LPTLILQVLEDSPKHGYRIAQDIKARSKGVLEYKEGTLYPALHNQEGKGLIESYERVENGRVRRYYRLTEKGTNVLAKDKQEWYEMSGAINAILEGA
jgi:DNA-binding PadR family transcriptional regulator